MTALRLTPAQLAACRALGWRRALVLALYTGAADDAGRVHDVSARDVARLLGVNPALVHRDVRHLAAVGALVVERRSGRASAVTINPAPQVPTPRRSALVKTLRRSAGADTQEVGRCLPTRVETFAGADTEVGTTADTQEVGRCLPPLKGESSASVVRASGAPLHPIPHVPTPRAIKVKTW